MINPVFSIIIPTFNSAKTIEACLDSIACQSFQNFEVIIVDGLSKDGTIEKAKQYLNKIPQLKWMCEKDNGIYDAMNKGIKLAKGEWLFFLGSDDRLNNSEVLSVIYKINKNKFDVVYGNAKIIGDTAWAKDGALYDGEFNLNKLLIKNICHQSMFYRKNCFSMEHSNFNIDYKLCADWDFNLRCWAQKPFLYVNILVADFYSGGLTSDTSDDQIISRDWEGNLIKYFGKNFRRNITAFEYPKKSVQRVLITIKNRLRSGLMIHKRLSRF